MSVRQCCKYRGFRSYDGFRVLTVVVDGIVTGLSVADPEADKLPDSSHSSCISLSTGCVAWCISCGELRVATSLCCRPAPEITPIPTPNPELANAILVLATGELWLLDVFEPGGLDGELLSEVEFGVDEWDVAEDLSDVRPLFNEPWRLRLPDPIC